MDICLGKYIHCYNAKVYVLPWNINLSFSHSHGDDKVWISPKLRKLLKGGNPPNVGLSSQIWDQPSISFYLTSKLNV